MTEPTLAQLERIDLAQKLQTIAEAKNLKTEAQLLAEGFATDVIYAKQLEAIMQGNNVHYDPLDPTKSVGALQMTFDEATKLYNKYDILEASPNDASGLSVVLLRDHDTGKYVMTVRSTEFLPKVGPNGEQLQGGNTHDVPADRELAANGFALAQIDRATSLLDSWVTKYNIGANQVQSVGYSLSGNITMTLNKLRPGYFDQTEGANIVFNSTGLGYIKPMGGGNAYVAALQTFRDMLYSPDAISNFNVDWDTRLSALPDDIRNELKAWQNAALGAPSADSVYALGDAGNIYDNARYQFARRVFEALYVPKYYELPGIVSLAFAKGNDGSVVDPTMTNFMSVSGFGTSGFDRNGVSFGGIQPGAQITMPIAGQAFMQGTNPFGGLTSMTTWDPNSDFGVTHSLMLLRQSSALFLEMKRLDPDLTVADFTSIWNAFGKEGATVYQIDPNAPSAEGDTVPHGVDVLSKWAGTFTGTTTYDSTNGGYANWNINQQYFGRLSAADSVLQGLRNSGAKIVVIANKSADELTALANDPNNPDREAYRFALAINSPYVITGGSSKPTGLLNVIDQYSDASWDASKTQNAVLSYKSTMTANFSNVGSPATTVTSDGTLIVHVPISENLDTFVGNFEDGFTATQNLGVLKLRFEQDYIDATGASNTRVADIERNFSYWDAIISGGQIPTFKSTFTDTATNQIVAVQGFSYFDNGFVHKTIETHKDGSGAVVGQSISIERADSGAVTKTVEANIGGNMVKATYTSDANGNLVLSSVDSINGQPPTDPQAARNAFIEGNITSDKLLNGSVDQAGQAAVSVFDATNPSGAKKLYDFATNYGTKVADALTLIRALQNGEPLPVVASGLKLATDLNANYNLAASAAVAGGLLAVMNLQRALDRGDELGALTAGTQALNYGTQAYIRLSGTFDPVASSMAEFLGGNSAYADGQGIFDGGSPGAIAYLNLVNDISNGDALGTTIDILAMTVPTIGVPLQIANTVLHLLGFFDESVPRTWGTGHYIWNGNSVAVTTQGESNGDVTVSGAMNQMLATLNAIIEQQRSLNPNASLGIIANRLPSFALDRDGFRLTMIDPATGQEKNPSIRYNQNGDPYLGVTAGSADSYISLSEAFLRSALERQAIAPMWEVETARLQTNLGDPMGGLSEEERAAQLGLAVGKATGPMQMMRTIALDLDGDGIETVDKANSHVAFDVDDTGYFKNTAWLKSDDAFLTLDRNINDSIDSGRELFSNGKVALTLKGLAGLRWVDANYDGRIDAADPVFNQLKIWRDLNQDGVVVTGEQTTLLQNGITQLTYTMGTFEQNGQKKQLASTDLEADTEGMQVHVTNDGIIVQNSNGQLSLLVTHVDDRTSITANRDGVTGNEDQELLINSYDLLANDSLGGFTRAQGLSVTSAFGFTHGTGYLASNGVIHYTPDVNYNGAANFSYTIQAPNSATATATVDITLQNQNDAPTVSGQQNGAMSIYGYSGQRYINDGGSWLPTAAQYQPYYGIDYQAYNNMWGWGDNGPTQSWHTTPIQTKQDPNHGRISVTDMDDPNGPFTYEIVGQSHKGQARISQFVTPIAITTAAAALPNMGGSGQVRESLQAQNDGEWRVAA